MKKRGLTIIIGTALMAGTQVWAEGNNQTLNNSGSAQNSVKASQQINLIIYNQTGVEVKSMRVVNAKDAIVLNVDKSNCKINALCSITLDRKFVNTFAYVKLLDKNNRLIGVAPLSSLPATANSATAYANNFGTGIYVYDKLHQNNSSIDFKRISSAFATPLAANYPFELLGAYFLDKMATNNYNSILVINRLATKLVSTTPKIEVSSTSPRLAMTESKLSAKPLKAASSGIKLGAASDSSYCAKGAQLGMKYTNNILGFLPGAERIFKLFNDINEDICKGDDHAADFAQINQKLDVIQQSVDRIETGIIALNNKVDIHTIKEKLQEYELLRTAMDDTINPFYTNFLIKADMPSMSSGAHPKSLYDFINAWGGWDQALNSSANNKAGLKNLLSQQHQLKLSFDSLANSQRAETFKGSLISLCDKYKDIDGNIIDIRNWCNFKTITTYANNATVTAKARIVFTDLRRTIDAYPSASKQNQAIDYLAQSDIDSSFNSFETAQTAILGTDAALFEPTAGLSDILLSSLDAVGCFDSVLVPSSNGTSKTMHVPNISEWYYKLSKNPYIVTRCDENYNGLGDYPHSEIQSKFYYDEYKSGEMHVVRNVMGVPVPSKYFTDPTRIDGDYGKILDCSERTGSRCTYQVKTPSTTQVSSTGFGQKSEYFYPQKDGSEFSDSGKTYWFFKKIETTSPSKTYEISFDRNSMFLQTTFIRSEFKGQNYITSWTTYAYMSKGAWEPGWYYALKCISNDCSVSGQDLQFVDGPTVSYTKDGSEYTLSVK